MPKDLRKFLYDIVEAIDFIFEDHLAEVDTFEVYKIDRTIQAAVERELIIIGEAVYKLQRQGIRLNFGDQVINRRNSIAHQYDAYSPESIWESVQNELPELKADAEKRLVEGLD